MPFRNTLCTFRISGADLRALARRYLESIVDHKASIQLSGLNCTWKRVNGGPEIQHLTVAGKEVSDASEYTCATSDFVINQADKYLGMAPASVTYLPTTVYQAIVAKVQREKIIDSRIENRFQETQ